VRGGGREGKEGVGEGRIWVIGFRGGWSHTQSSKSAGAEYALRPTMRSGTLIISAC